MNNIFARIIGKNYAALPPAVREFHEISKGTYVGTATVKGDNHFAARLIRRLFGFPIPATTTPVTVFVSRTSEVDQWRRDFGGRQFSSSFSQNQADTKLSESFGPFLFYFSLSVRDARLIWNFERWALGFLPLPKFLGPRIVSWEGESENGGYRFFSEAHFPILGQLIHYDGTVFLKNS